MNEEEKESPATHQHNERERLGYTAMMYQRMGLTSRGSEQLSNSS